MMQSALSMLYPPQCLTCHGLVEDRFSLCGACWRGTPFITGLVCDLCGVSLVGDGHGDELCDDCMTIERPWQQGRAAVIYKDNARKIVLALKHGDRHDLARPAARWMVRAGAALLTDDPLIVPIPLHRFRLLRRRYNQSALLAGEIAREAGLTALPDALIRARRTETQDNKDLDARFKNVEAAITAHPKRGQTLHGRNVVLIDDVMTSGATFSAATGACFHAGAKKVCVLALARVAKDA